MKEHIKLVFLSVLISLCVAVVFVPVGLPQTNKPNELSNVLRPMLDDTSGSVTVALETNVDVYMPTKQVMDQHGDIAWMKEIQGDTKWERTTIKEVTTLHFDWMGKEREIKQERIVTNHCEKYSLVQTWKLTGTNEHYPIVDYNNADLSMWTTNGSGFVLTNNSWGIWTN